MIETPRGAKIGQNVWKSNRPTQAMAGVVDYVSHTDVTGENVWRNNVVPEELFCTGTVGYAGQVIGLIVAESRDIAVAAAKMVNVSYSSQGEWFSDEPGRLLFLA